MRPLRLLFVICFALWQCSTALSAAEFRLNNGDIIRGEPVTFNDDGLVVRLDIGGYSPRISWSKLTQESLQELMKNPQAAKFVEPFIDVPPAPKDKDKKKRQIVLKSVPRVERVENPSFFSSIATPGGLAVFLVLFLANVYAAYEIARFKYRPPALVCGVSILLPVLGPILFLAMPPAPPIESEDAGLAEPAAAAAAAGKATTGSLAKVPSMASGLSLAQAEKAGGAAAGAGPQVYKRGEFTFNRRFVETKFGNFFRVVQSEADKDLVLLVRTQKQEFLAKRISRISSTEMHVQLVRGGEESVNFSDITEIQVRHKDAKG